MAEGKERKLKFLDVIREFIEGAVVREPMLVAIKEKASLENLLLLVIFGDTLGIPIPRSYYSLRLLPYVVPRLEAWKRGLLRQKDWTDIAFD
ncbi:MAG: hypothetical protein HY913_07790 [Desulfomonile tiedjei]|nr:hypothetical protein [Desulfomonile tiedjei]